jgi:hypothetical protein
MLEVVLLLSNTDRIQHVEDYVRRKIKREVDQDPELESLSDWVRTIRSLVQYQIHMKTAHIYNIIPIMNQNL